MLTEEEIQELLAKNPNSCKQTKRTRRIKAFRIMNISVLTLSVAFVILCIWSLISIHFEPSMISGDVTSQLIVAGTSVRMQLIISLIAVGISAIGVFLMVCQMSVFDRWMKNEYER